MKISVITTCLNSQNYILATVSSVLNQSVFLDGTAELEYIVKDAGSSDRTVQVVEELGDPRIFIQSETDTGLYDGLAKGLKEAQGEIVCYINAGDLLVPHAFSVVQKVFTSLPEVKFLTGINTIINESNEVVSVTYPFRYRKQLMLRGCYGKFLPFVQQESTFWRREIMSDKVLIQLKKYKLAGDMFLWHSFSQSHKLYIVNSTLGCFKIHPNQLSEDQRGYFDEAKTFLLDLNFFFWILLAYDYFLWKLPPSILKKLNAQEIITYDKRTGKWAI